MARLLATPHHTTTTEDIMRFHINPDLTAFRTSTLGSKVANRRAFEMALADALDEHDTSADRAPGQHFVRLPESAIADAGVTCGIGSRQVTNKRGHPLGGDDVLIMRGPEHYVMREHRGLMTAYLKRRNALPCANLNCVVYTSEAFNADPQVIKSGRHAPDWSTHVIVAVLASPAGTPTPPRGTFRLADCLAGGNKEADTWTLEDVRIMCKESVGFELQYCVVSD